MELEKIVREQAQASYEANVGRPKKSLENSLTINEVEQEKVLENSLKPIDPDESASNDPDNAAANMQLSEGRGYKKGLENSLNLLEISLTSLRDPSLDNPKAESDYREQARERQKCGQGCILLFENSLKPEAKQINDARVSSTEAARNDENQKPLTA